MTGWASNQGSPHFTKLEQRPEGDEGISHAVTWAEGFIGGRSRECQGPGVDACLWCYGNHKEARMAGMEASSGTRMALPGHFKDLASTPNEMGSY